MSLRDKKLKDYGITNHRYRELLYFCLQYNEWKAELRYGWAAVEHTGLAAGSKSNSKVEKEAMRNVELRKKMELIEQAAVATDATIYPYIIKNVTNEKMPYEYLGNVPVCKRDFYALRRKFFGILHKMKKLDH